MTAIYHPTSSDDVFEDVLNLEEQYFREGYELGVADGSKSGRVEGRLFGLEKGFDKFLDMGRLNGRAVVWETRSVQDRSGTNSQGHATLQLPSLAGSDRLRKHIDRLAALSDPDDLSTTNSEDAVSDVDDRLKDAKAKATLIAKIAGENESYEVDVHNVLSSDVPTRSVRARRNEEAAAPRPTGEMEDFIGLPGAR